MATGGRQALYKDCIALKIVEGYAEITSVVEYTTKFKALLDTECYRYNGKPSGFGTSITTAGRVSY